MADPCNYCHDARLVGWSGAGPILCPECSRGQDAFTVITQAWREQRAKVRELEDCGQDGVCAIAPGCNRHWEERTRELAAERERLNAIAYGESERAKALEAELARRHIARPTRRERRVMTDDRSSNPELEWFEEQLRDKRIAELEYERRCILFQTREQWARRARNAEARERELLAMHHEDQARIARLEEALQKAEHELESVDPAPGSAFDEVLQAIREALADKGEGR